MKNRIREFRKEKGITQKQLGKKVGTSQQNIQRIEAGITAPRFDLATDICKVLGNPFRTVFPGTKKTINSYKKGKNFQELPFRDEKFGKREMSEGMDIEVNYWFLMFRLRGGYEATIRFSELEKNRLWQILQRKSLKQFCIFDTDKERVLINLDHLIFSQLLFEGPNPALNPEEEDPGSQVKIYTSDKETPFIFDVEADDKPLEDETADWEDIQFQDICDTADMMMTDYHVDEVLMFADADGETAFFRFNDVAMVKIPLEVLCSEIDKKMHKC